uniref:Uncharacterized protein n=1 Tax=Arundo donax TaxID=35708 RepID=A0A0A9F442_ARUDO
MILFDFCDQTVATCSAELRSLTPSLSLSSTAAVRCEVVVGTTTVPCLSMNGMHGGPGLLAK